MTPTPDRKPHPSSSHVPRLPKTVPLQFSLGEGIDVGMDVGSPVDFTYELPFKFTGKIDKVTIALGKAEVGTRRATAA